MCAPLMTHQKAYLWHPDFVGRGFSMCFALCFTPEEFTPEDVMSLCLIRSHLKGNSR
jgi:ADP-ribosylglycohydrolase